MNFARKNTLIWLMTAVLVLLALVCSRADDEVEVPLSFCVESASGTERIALYDEGAGEYILFLPSYAELGQVILATAPEGGVMIGSEVLSEGADCGDLELEAKYPLSLAGKDSGTIRFLRSANVATMFIDTATGSMLRIHEDKNYRESAAVRLYTADGIQDYSEPAVSLKGRGNATWDYEKKPYLLTLPTDSELLGMAAASGWVLLANTTDESNLRNKLVLDLSRQVGMEWVPDCTYVDVYLNGDYNGLYLMTEKVEVHPNRLDLDTDSGAFLCKIDLSERWDTLQGPFLTQAGRTVELTAPEVLSEEQRAEVVTQVNRMEQLIFSGAPISYMPDVDWDSWARRYLIDEISGNIDSDLASSYFYYSDGVFKAGPVWDYDMTFGNSLRNRMPNSYMARNLHRSRVCDSPYYSTLLSNSSFHEHMTGIYVSEFLPVLEKMVDGGIRDLADEISAASKLNSVRWQEQFSELYQAAVISTTPETMIEYLNERMDFLNSAWIEGVEYCTLQFEHTEGNFFENITVKKGDVFASDSIDTSDTVWFEADSGMVYDFSQPVTEDAVLVKQSIAQPQSLATRDYITIASIIGLVFLLLSFGAVDLIRRNKERRRTNAGEKVSP